MQAPELLTREQDLFNPPAWFPTRYYRIDTTKLTHAEVSGNSGWSAWFKISARQSNRRDLRAAIIPEPAPLSAATEVSQAYDRDLRERLAPVLHEAEQHNLKLSLYYAVPGELTPGLRQIGVLLLNPSDDLMVTAVYSVWDGRSSLSINVLSWLSDDTFILTTDSQPLLKMSPRVREQVLTGVSLHQLIQKHRERQDELKADLFHARPLLTLDQAGKLHEEVERENTGWQISRGVYVALTPREISAAKRRALLSDNWDEPVTELDFDIQHIHRTQPVKTESTAEVTWTFTLDEGKNSAGINLEVDLPSGALTPGKFYEGRITVSPGKGQSFAQGMQRLLQIDAETALPPIRMKSLPVILEFFGRTELKLEPDGPEMDLNEEGNWFQFSLSFVDIDGGFHLQLNESTREGCLSMQPELDRSAAYEVFAGLFLK